MARAVFQLEALTCPSCINKIETTLNRITGVEIVTVLFNSSKVRAQFDETKVEANLLEEKIKKLGYPVLSTKVS